MLNFSVLMLLLLVTACAPARPSSENVQAAPERIVSLSPGITESLFEMGLGPKVVGVGRFDNYPEAARRLPRVGGYLDPNWEAILRLNPDLLLVMESQEEILARAESLGLHCRLIDQHDIEAVLASFEQIGACCGDAEAGRSLRLRVESRLKEISVAVENRPKPRVLVVAGRSAHEPIEVVWAAAPGSLYDDLLRFAGAVNVISDGARGPYPEISREGILSLDPDIILDLVTESPTQAVDPELLLKDWETLAPLRARRQGRIHILAEPWLVIPGPRVVQSLEIFLKTLHPELP